MEIKHIKQMFPKVIFFLKVDNVASSNNLFNHDEHAFDIDAPPILPTDDYEGGNGDPDDSFMGGVEMDVNDDNVEESDAVVCNIDIKSFMQIRQPLCRSRLLYVPQLIKYVPLFLE